MKKIIIILILIVLLGCQKETVVDTSFAQLAPTLQEKQINNEISYTTTWYFMKNAGDAQYTFTYDKMEAYVTNAGEKPDDLYFYYEGIPLVQSDEIKVQFDLETSDNRSIRIQFLNDLKEVVYETMVTPGHVELQFKVEQPTTHQGAIQILLGKTENVDQYASFDVVVKNFLYQSSTTDTRKVRINQVGYLPDEKKMFVVPYTVGDFFEVVDTKTNEVVYRGSIGQERVNDAAQEVNYVGDFSELKTLGSYKIQTQIALTSYEFLIDHNVYQDVYESAYDFLNIQKSGVRIERNDFTIEAGHTQLAHIYGTDHWIDVSGGWYDAGDYGRYVKTTNKTIMDLLVAYRYNGYRQEQSLLEMARYGLEWLLKMQDESSGGVYNKVVTSGFSDYVLPYQDTNELFVLPISTNTTAGFAGVMAYAADSFSQVDEAFSKKCLQASLKAYEYLKEHPENDDPLNPEALDAGEYRDNSDKDERFFASSLLYYVTGEKDYLSDALALDEQVKSGFSWNDFSGYGRYFLAKKKVNGQIERYLDHINEIVGTIESNDYFVSIEQDFNWGSNFDILNNGIALLLAYQMTEAPLYKVYAYEQLNYVLGKNSLNMSFVTGYGSVYPKNIHSRLAIAGKINLEGALVGGANRNLEDAIMASQGVELPPAKAYIDNRMSYSTNEVAIYYNASLLFLLSNTK